MTDADLTETDRHFLLSLHHNGKEMDIGTGAFPRGMNDRRARKLWAAGYVKGEEHTFGRDRDGLRWSGIRYLITPKGFDVIKDTRGVSNVDTRWADYVAMITEPMHHVITGPLVATSMSIGDVVSIDLATGGITRLPGFTTTDAAALAFWEAVERLAPSRKTDDIAMTGQITVGKTTFDFDNDKIIVGGH